MGYLIKYRHVNVSAADVSVVVLWHTIDNSVQAQQTRPR